MKIVPNTLKIGNLFNIPNEQFSIPAYQRRYAWGERQLNDFFTDINLLGENDTHLLGTVVFLTEAHSAGINILELIDGQQRITTLSILLHVLAEKLPEDSDSAREIRKYLSCRTGDVSATKLALGDLDNEDYQALMSDNGKNIENSHLGFAYRFFSEKVAAIPDIEDFYGKLTNNVEVIRLEIAEAKDAYKLFETINNRGLKLSATDIVKNFLLGHASLLGPGILAQVKKDWTRVIVSLDHIPGSSDRFLRQFLMGILRTKVPASLLVEDLKNYYYANVREAIRLTDHRARMERMGKPLTPEADEADDEGGEDAQIAPELYQKESLGILDFSTALRNAAETYARIIEANTGDAATDRHLRNLRRIEATPAYTFLLNLFQRADVSANDTNKVLFLLETFVLRRQICEYRTAELDDIFSHLVGVSSVDIVENVRKELKEYTPGNQEFKERFILQNHKRGDDRAKYILEQIELYLLGNANEFSVNSGTEVHLEHIIPQTIKTKKAKTEFGDWITYLGDHSLENHSRYIFRIGNLTILDGVLNIRAQNNPFATKLEAYRDSAFRLNSMIREAYLDFRYEQVEERSRTLSDLALQIWK